MSSYLEMASDKIPAENMDIQMKNEQDLDALQQDIEMSGGSSGSYTSENKGIGHKSHSNGADENGKETAMIMESLDSCKRYDLILKLNSASDP